MKIQAIDDAEERKTAPPQPPGTPNQPTRSQAPNAPLRPPPQSRLDEILDKYKEDAGEMSNADWKQVQRIRRI